MNFLTLYFAVFFIIILFLLSRITDVKVRNVVLLLGNLVFLSLGDVRCLAVIITESIICYFSALKTEKDKAEGRSGKTCLIPTVIMLILVLAVVKYFVIAGSLGISFYSLMMISYTVDVYRGKMKAEKDALAVFLYFSFFPHIMSGPITKARDMMGQCGYWSLHGLYRIEEWRYRGG